MPVVAVQQQVVGSVGRRWVECTESWLVQPTEVCRRFCGLAGSRDWAEGISMCGASTSRHASSPLCGNLLHHVRSMRSFIHPPMTCNSPRCPLNLIPLLRVHRYESYGPNIPFSLPFPPRVRGQSGAVCGEGLAKQSRREIQWQDMKTTNQAHTARSSMAHGPSNTRQLQQQRPMAPQAVPTGKDCQYSVLQCGAQWLHTPPTEHNGCGSYANVHWGR